MRRDNFRKRGHSTEGATEETGGYSFEDYGEQYNLEVKKIETSKDSIKQPALAAHENMYIPPLGSSIVISGKSGSGKSTLLANLLLDPRFYGPQASDDKSGTEKNEGWFDKIFLFSPTANGDDIQKSLNIPKKYVFTDLEEAPELLSVILSSQQTKLEGGKGADKVTQFCIIFDDVIGDVQFMNAKSFTQCFYQVRHVNCTTFICTQHFKRVPKVCRLQANFIFFFAGSASEVEIVTEEFAPPKYSKNEFRELVNDATAQPYTFLTINMKVGWDKRFRRNLNEFVKLDRLTHDQKRETPTPQDDTESEYDEGDTDDAEEEEDFDRVLELMEQETKSRRN